MCIVKAVDCFCCRKQNERDFSNATVNNSLQYITTVVINFAQKGQGERVGIATNCLNKKSGYEFVILILSLKNSSGVNGLSFSRSASMM